MSQRPVVWLTDSPGFGGSEVNLLRVLRFTAGRPAVLAHRPDLTPGFLAAITASGVPTYRIRTGATLAQLPAAVVAAGRLLRAFPGSPVVVWSHYTDSSRWVQPVLALAGRRYAVVEQYVPAARAEVAGGRLSVPLKRWTVGPASVVVLNAWSQADHYRQLFRVGRRNLRVIVNSRPVGELAARADALRVDRVTLRGRLGLPLAVPIGVCVARLTAVKEQATLIRAWAGLADPTAVLVLVGDGPDREALERQATGLGGRVVFAGHQHNPTDWLAAADLFLLPSMSEGLPGALIEAMAVGLPCVASDIPGNRDLVSDEETGLLVPVADPSAVTAAVNRLLVDPQLAARLGAAGRQRVADGYDEPAEAAAWGRLLDQLGGA